MPPLPGTGAPTPPGMYSPQSLSQVSNFLEVDLEMVQWTLSCDTRPPLPGGPSTQSVSGPVDPLQA